MIKKIFGVTFAGAVFGGYLQAWAATPPTGRPPDWDEIGSEGGTR